MVSKCHYTLENGLPLERGIKGRDIILDRLFKLLKNLDKLLLVDFSDKTQTQVSWLVHVLVELANTFRSKNAESISHATSFIAETDVLGVKETTSLEVHDLRTAELNSLHLGVDNTSIVAFAVNVPDFSHYTFICDGRQDDMLEIDGENLGEAIPTSGLEGISCVIGSSPGVGVRVSSGRELVEETLVLVALGTHEDEMLKGMRST
jgi:hypothetical protein